MNIKTAPDLRSRAEIYYRNSRKYVLSSKPYASAKKYMAEKKKNSYDRDLSESLAYIKNMVVLGRGENISGELLLSELADISEKLAPVYLQMAGLLHTNDKNGAMELFINNVSGNYSRDMAKLLAGWEDIPPSELLSTVELYQTGIREEKLTKQLQKDELISDIVYFPVVVNCMMVLLNFIYVGYFIAQREALMLLY